MTTKYMFSFGVGKLTIHQKCTKIHQKHTNITPKLYQNYTKIHQNTSKYTKIYSTIHQKYTKNTPKYTNVKYQKIVTCYKIPMIDSVNQKEDNRNSNTKSRDRGLAN